jgi:hypothetical protein
MHLSKGQFPTISIIQFVHFICSIHYFQSFNCLYLKQECFNITPYFHTNSNYYNSDQNLNNNFVVFIC